DAAGVALDGSQANLQAAQPRQSRHGGEPVGPARRRATRWELPGRCARYAGGLWSLVLAGSGKLLHRSYDRREILLDALALLDGEDLVRRGRRGNWHLLLARQPQHVSEILPHESERKLSRVGLGPRVLELRFLTGREHRRLA